MNYKRTVCLLLTAALMFSFSGCSLFNKEEPSFSATPEPTAVVESENSEAEERNETAEKSQK